MARAHMLLSLSGRNRMLISVCTSCNKILEIPLTVLGTIGHVDHGKVQETRDRQEARTNVIFRPH
jgi:hypothetical protein